MSWWRRPLQPDPIAESAARIGLRDKGPVQEHWKRDDVWAYTACMQCGTRARVGITGDGCATLYCWRCECRLTNPGKTPAPIVAEAR